MIQVSIDRDGEGRVISYSVKGHARYDDPGKDIVCAGVSAVTVGTVNSIEALLGIKLQHKVKDGLLQASVPQVVEAGKLEGLQLLLESMIVMLKSIEEAYGDYVTVREHNKSRRR